MSLAVSLLLASAGQSVDAQTSGTPNAAAPTAAPPTASHQYPAPLPGRNEVSGLTVKRDDEGRWVVSFDYFYTGEPAMAMLKVRIKRPPGMTDLPYGQKELDFGGISAQRGRHSHTLMIGHAGFEQPTTTPGVMGLLMVDDTVIASAEDKTVIAWPAQWAWIQERELASKSVEQLIHLARTRIDQGQEVDLTYARKVLDRALAKDPRAPEAFIELARIALIAKWGTEGWRQAESLLQSALLIDPLSTNARILMGHVLAYQGRHKESEAVLTEAAKRPNNNLWLWVNWGQLYLLQGKVDQAMAKFQLAVAQPPVNDTYDRARREAFRRMLILLKERGDLNFMEALHKQRVDDYADEGCFNADYGRFMLLLRGNAQAAITSAKHGLAKGCEVDSAREVLGLAHYVIWGNQQVTGWQSALHQARIYLPLNAKALLLMAASDSTHGALKALLASGEKIDQLDNQSLTALTMAVVERDWKAATVLIKLGAKPNALVGQTQVPVAMIPVLNSDLEGVKFFKRMGVDFSKLRFQGMTALEIARQIGHRAVLEGVQRTAGSM
jgi:Tfp pilus assembly protein PilF